MNLAKQTRKVAAELKLLNPDYDQMLNAIRKQKIIVQQRFIESLVHLYEDDELKIYADYNKWLQRPRDTELSFSDKRQAMVIYAVEGQVLEEAH